MEESRTHSPDLDTFPGDLESFRDLYQGLDADKRAHLIRIVVRSRFTEPLFDRWLRASGVEAAELQAHGGESVSARERLEESLLQEGNEDLLVAALTSYLREADGDTVRGVAGWVSQAKAEAGAGAVTDAVAPGQLVGENQEAEVAASGSGRDAGPCGPSGEWPGDKVTALAWLSDLEGLMARVEEDIVRLKNAVGGVDLGSLERKLGRANHLAWGLREYGATLGHWNTSAELRDLIGTTPDTHAIWAEGLADYLETVTVAHPLRRKRELAGLLREAAIGELRNFATLGGVEEEVPGPSADVGRWWAWVTTLTDSEFAAVEEWCGSNSLDHLADFVAEQWTLSRGMEGAGAVAEALSEASSLVRMEARQAQRPASPGVVGGASPGQEPNRKELFP